MSLYWCIYYMSKELSIIHYLKFYNIAILPGYGECANWKIKKKRCFGASHYNQALTNIHIEIVYYVLIQVALPYLVCVNK
jgi:hypothetical protein